MHRIEVITEGSIDINKTGLSSLRPIKVYSIKDDFSAGEMDPVRELLVDPIVDRAGIDVPVLDQLVESSLVEVCPKPGVNNPEGDRVQKSLSQILGRSVGQVSVSHEYLWQGVLDENSYAGLKKLLGNIIINDFRVHNDWKSGIPAEYPDVSLDKVAPFKYVDLSADLLKISNDRLLSLNLAEMETIRDLFKDEGFAAKRKSFGLDAQVTDAELEALAQTWSEHCCHKRFNADWIYTSDDPNDEAGLPSVTHSVLKSIIMESTNQISPDWLVSVFKDNAGVIKLNDRWNISHKVETHNFPSGVDGFGGANTGTGGVLRDPASTGTYMDPVSSQWNFRVPPPDSCTDLPFDIQSPSRALSTIVDGVEDYGNKMGIPTMSGAVMMHDGWLKPAVYVGCVAVAPAQIDGKLTHVKDVRPGYVALTLGGKVGKDGIHGATASSIEGRVGDEKRKDVNQSVQIGNPIVEKEVFEVMKILQLQGLIEASQDCGAGGWNSAVGELAGLLCELEEKRFVAQAEFKKRGIVADGSVDERLAVAASIDALELNELASPVTDLLKREIASGDIFSRESNGKGGVVLDLSSVKEKYAGLEGWEKLVSEAQEREVIVVKEENVARILEICDHLEVEALQIGEFNDSGYYHVKDQHQTIAFLPVDFLHHGLPKKTIKAHWTPCSNLEPELFALEDLTETALKLLARPNMQLYDWIMTRYDHEVRGGSRIKPIVGIGRGRSDAIAYVPVLGEKETVIETWGSNPWQGDIDAYHMGRNNVVDAIGKMIAVGGNLDKVTFNGNTTCPNPEGSPEVAAKVIRMLKGAADAQIVFGTPTISGKDSTSMSKSYTSTVTGEKVTKTAKPELLLSALGVLPDDSTLITADFKLPHDSIYVVGDTRDECGGSEWYFMHDETGRNVPKSNLDEIKSRYLALNSAIKSKLVHSAQYVSKGGLAFALANSAIAGDLGIDVVLDPVDELGRADKLLFSETTGRFVVSVHASKKREFESVMKDRYVKEIGWVREDKKFLVSYDGNNVISSDVDVVRKENKGAIRS